MRKFLYALIAIWIVINLSAQQQAPKLVVYITIDQLRGDYIDYFYHTFGEYGFKRLMNEGAVFHNIRFEYANVDQANAYATLFTGANPCDHGITHDKIYEFDRDREVSPFFDPNYLGNFTSDNYSPNKLLASTIGDELKRASNGASEVFSIALDAESAIIAAGHAANAAFWIDNITGKWATTTYYRGAPWYIDTYNNNKNQSITDRMNSMTWQPTLPINQYIAFPYVQDKVTFNHVFRAYTVDCFPRIKSSPFGNKEVNRLVFQFLEYAEFGTRPNPDMLSITYYAGNYFNNMAKEYSFEIQDMYIQLDKDIEELLNALDNKVGLQNTLVVLSGTGYFKAEEEYSTELQFGGGEFYPSRCLSLLNMYLMALYGDKNWIKYYYNNQIYFNRKIIEEELKLDLAAFQKLAADLVSELSGVARVTTDKELRSGIWNNDMADFYRGTHFAGRGDLIIELQPGWRINTEKPNEKGTYTRNNAVQTPLIFMGAGIKPQRIFREVKATEVAPTITHLLRIRPPNACKDIPLYEILHY